MSRYFRSNIATMVGYIPGEQLQDQGFIKLNTNENPYGPSPRVLAAIASAVGNRPSSLRRCAPNRVAAASKA